MGNLFYQVGGNGPTILFFVTIYLLWKNSKNLLSYYIFGSIISAFLNLIIKGIIQEPRPSENPKKFKLALKSGTRFEFKNGKPHDIFGMPSGHSQSSLFSTVFMYLSLKNIHWLYFYLGICLITITQRVVYNFHTIPQVIAGSFVGICFGYIVYYLAQHMSSGKNTMKKWF
jgi:membrane-associated phospholipid phosphatase